MSNTVIGALAQSSFWLLLRLKFEAAHERRLVVVLACVKSTKTVPPRSVSRQMTESDFASGDWFNATNGTNSTGGGSGFQPSTPLCIGLSAFGGFLEVSSTMVLAFPEFKTKMGAWQPSKCRDRIMMVLNLVLMGVASVAYIVGSWFGPVSLSVPVVMVSKLLFNMVLMGLVLRMTSFSKDQQVGTYCIACAILTLPEVGPMDQPGADVLALIVQPVALAWISVLTLATVVCVVGMVVLARRSKRAAKRRPRRIRR